MDVHLPQRISVEDVAHTYEENIVVKPEEGRTITKHPLQDRVFQRVGDDLFSRFGAKPLHLSGIFVLCDGHGKPGEHASEWFSRRLVDLAEEMCYKFEASSPNNKSCMSDSEVISGLKRIFAQADDEYKAIVVQNDFMKEHDSGTTASLALVYGHKLFISTVGDSRVLVCAVKANNGKQLNPIFESEDHEVDQHNEDTQRALAAGGRVTGGGHYVAVREGTAAADTDFPQHTMLNMTRSLGNYAFKADPENPVVSGEPDISVVDLAGFSNAYLLIASDGMWNHITDDDDHNVQREAVLEVLRSYVDQSTGALDCSAACEELKRRCRMLAHGSATSRGFYFDDLSCILNELRL